MPLLYHSHALIEPKTAAETQNLYLTKKDLPCRLSAVGLAGVEQVTIQTLEGPEGTYKGTPYRDGAALVLKATDQVITLYGDGPYEINKPVTAGAAGVFWTKG